MHSITKLLLLSSLSLIKASNFRLDTRQECFYYGCGRPRGGGYINADWLKQQNWTNMAKVGKAPNGETKFIIPYILVQHEKTKAKNHDWVRKAEPFFQKAVSLFENTTVHFQEYTSKQIHDEKVNYLNITDYLWVGSMGCTADIGPRQYPIFNHVEIGHDDCYTNPAQVAHELMHTLGILHEHQRLNQARSR